MITDEIADEVRRLELATRRLVRDLSAGDYASAFRGRGIEFQDVREYQPGDDVRTIDWRVTARLGVTYLRRHHEERELTMLLLVDESASAQVGSRRRTRSELSAQVAAVLALTAAHANDRVGAAFFSGGLGRMVAPRKGRRHALRVLGELLAARADGATTDLGAALDALEPLLPRRVVLVILSDFYTSGYQLPLARLARKHEVICMQLRDSIEQALPAVGLVRLRDPESGVIVTVDASSVAVREMVAERRARFDETLAHDLYASGSELVRLDASGDFAEPLVAFFRRRARR